MLRTAIERASIHGFRLCSSAPIISYLLFADDTIIFCRADLSHAILIKDLLDKYAAALGQLVNYSKTDVSFSKGVQPARRTAITIALDIREVLSHDKYLGLSTFVGRSRKKPFLVLIDRLKKRLSSWMGRLASWAGREVLIKAVAQAIPTYSMSVFKLPVDLCHTIQASINRFWWGHK